MNKLTKTFNIFSLSIALSLSAFAQDTPVEKEFEKLFDSVVATLPEAKEVEPEELEEMFASLLTTLREVAPQWTEEDAKKLKENKPLVDNFDNVRKFYNKNEALKQVRQHPLAKDIFDKINNPKITHLEKRLFKDLVGLVKLQSNKAKATVAISNGKDIYIAFRDYSFNRGGETPGKLGDKKSANDIFNTLFKAGIITDENPFLIPNSPGFKEKVTENGFLDIGENCYAVNVGTNIQTDKANTPLLLIPLVEVDGKIIADKNQLGGQAVIIFIDGSGIICKINDKGEILDDDGKNILDPKHQYWEERKPDIRLPRMKPFENKEIVR